MSDLVKRLQATLTMGVIASGSSAHEYAVAEKQIQEAIWRIHELEAFKEKAESYYAECEIRAGKAEGDLMAGEFGLWKDRAEAAEATLRAVGELPGKWRNGRDYSAAYFADELEILLKEQNDE